MKKYLLLALFLFPLQSFATIAFFQNTTGSCTTAMCSTTAFGSTVVAGDLIVITVTDDSGLPDSITNVTDTGANTYTQILIKDSSATTRMYYTKVVTGGSSFTVTTTRNANASRVVIIAQEFNGFLGTATLDQHTFAFNTGTAADSGASGTTINANEVVVGGFGHAGATSVWSLGTGYSNLGTVNVTNAASAQESKVVSSTGTQNATANIVASRDWVAGVATFYDSVGTTLSLFPFGTLNFGSGTWNFAFGTWNF